MGVRNGRNYIVSVSITPEMHDFINSRRKGSRSAFIRRAIYNAEKYDVHTQGTFNRITNLEEQRANLMLMVAYQQARINSIISSGQDIDNFHQWVLTEGSYYPDLDKQSWRDAKDAIEGLIPHIEGLSNVLLVFDGTGGGRIEGV